jgi:dihydroorotate dehydrogenase electron transfer subunit
VDWSHPSGSLFLRTFPRYAAAVTSVEPARNSRRHQLVATVLHNQTLCREHYRLVLKLPRFAPTLPGQFIQIACRDIETEHECQSIDWEPGKPLTIHDEDLLSPHAMLRRPFSLAGRRDTRDAVELDIIHRVVGLGTDWLARLNVGDAVNILGPLGNCFPLPPADHTAVLVGGGVGIPPMLYLATALSGRSAIAFCGATTRDLMALTVTDNGQADEFARQGIQSILSTDDGSLGFRGFVTQALEHWLDTRPTPHASRTTIIYTCGPEPMMKRVAEIALARNIQCQIAVERAMACGMGTCQSCVIRVKAPADPKRWVYKLACTDGPIFKAESLLW